MKILLLAPHPFYQERGTPIAIDLLLRVLSHRGHEVDVITFHEGEERTYHNIRLLRATPWFGMKIQGIPPGFSWKKILCDSFLFFKFLRQLMVKKYDVVHAVEESVFMALLICPIIGKPYIFDMDSSMVTQLMDKFSGLKVIERPLRFIESLPMRFASIVMPVCQALADYAKHSGAKKIKIVPDISLLDALDGNENVENLKDEFSITGPMILYVGNLESYQGIDLLIESFVHVVKNHDNASLMIVGGKEEDIQHYKQRAAELNLAKHVCFAGPRPVQNLGGYLKQADILVSPRVHGVNTPMKVYTYLHSGVPVVATDLPTHTQVINEDVAVLAKPEPGQFGESIAKLLDNPELGGIMAQSAVEFIEKRYSFNAFQSNIDSVFKELKAMV